VLEPELLNSQELLRSVQRAVCWLKLPVMDSPRVEVTAWGLGWVAGAGLGGGGWGIK